MLKLATALTSYLHIYTHIYFLKCFNYSYTQKKNKDDPMTSVFLSFNRSQLLLSVWHTLSSQIPMCIFLTLPPSFSHSLSHIAPRLAIYSLPQLLWKDICLPRDSSIPACLAVAQLLVHIFFLPAVYLFADQSSLCNLHHSERGCPQSRYTADHVLPMWWHGHTFKYT